MASFGYMLWIVISGQAGVSRVLVPREKTTSFISIDGSEALQIYKLNFVVYQNGSLKIKVTVVMDSLA